MKIAVLCLCHKNPRQINLLTKMLEHSSIDIYIHIDKKSRIENGIKLNDHIFLLPEEYRIDVEWAKISQVLATLNLLSYAKMKNKYDFFWLMSGQDFPIKSVETIYDFFLRNSSFDFINLFDEANRHDKKRNEIFYPQWIIGRKLYQRVLKRIWIGITGGYNYTFHIFRRNRLDISFYFGSQWWCLSTKVIDWMFSYLAQNSEYYKFYKNCVCPDESFFQTLYMNSPFATHRKNYLTFVNWKEKSKNSPEILTEEDYQMLITSPYLMARKFDIEMDENIIFKLQNNVNSV